MAGNRVVAACVVMYMYMAMSVTVVARVVICLCSQRRGAHFPVPWGGCIQTRWQGRPIPRAVEPLASGSKQID